MIVVAAAGLAAVIFLPRLEAGDRTLRYDWNPFSTYVHSFRAMRGSPLLWVMLSWGFFYFVAGLALMVIPEYSDVLAIDRKRASLILGVMGLAIGVGSAAAGLISGDQIKPRLVPFGALGLTVFFALLGAVPPTFLNVCLFVGGAGVFAGFYIIPLQALLQKLSPADERGRFLGTANGLAFCFLCAAGILYWTLRPAFGETPQRMFLVSAGALVIGGGLLLLRLRKLIYTPGQETEHSERE